MIKVAVERWGAAISLALALLVPWNSVAQIAVPQLVGHITDTTGTLSQEQQAQLEQKLTTFESQRGTQLAVLIIPSVGSEGIEQFALRVAEQWKLGRKQVDDGVILLVAKDDRTVRIEVGYGLEGALSDIVSKRIISESIVPRFKQGDFFGGIESGIDKIVGMVGGEPLPETKSSPQTRIPSIQQFFPFVFIVALGLGSVLRNIFGKVGGSFISGVLVAGLAWFLIGIFLYAALAGMAVMLVNLVGAGTVLRGVGGLYGGGYGGSGSGGFRGGGGGFGGGGASGRW